jgi:NitT/TauT family transport system substrate-binding protein
MTGLPKALAGTAEKRQGFRTGRMTSMTRGAVISSAVAALLLAGCSKEKGAPAGGPRLTPVILQANWYAEAEYGGFYEALAKGYFREENLDVHIAQGGPGAYPVQKVATGQVQFGLARSDDLILAAQQKIPILIVAAQLEHDPQVIIVHAESPVNGFKDLGGRSIMAEPGSAWISYLEKKYLIHIGTIPENYGIAQFLADRNFIQQGFLTAEPFVFNQLKVPTRSLLIADSGYDPYRALFCRRDFASSHPDVVKGFIRASIRGWQDYLGVDPSPGNELITRDHSESTAAVLAYGWEQFRKVHIVDGDAAKGERISLITRRRLEAQVEILHRVELLSGDITVDQFASFDFLPEDLQVLARN